MERVESYETSVEKTPNTSRKVVKTTENEIPREYGKKKAIFHSYQLIWYVLGFIEVVLAFRVIFRLFGANPGSPFVALVYSVSSIFSAPFRGIFGTPAVGSSAFEFSTIIGMIVYVVIAWGIVKLLQMVKPVEPDEVERGIDQA